ncbi:MAG: type VI secretion system ATPase TssH, partial [Gammaproteobacteria bacterium]
EDLLLGLLDDASNDLNLILRHYAVEPSELRAALQGAIGRMQSDNPGRPVISRAVSALVRDAWLLASVEFRDTEIRSGLLLLALIKGQRDIGTQGWGAVIAKIPTADLTARYGEVVNGSSETVSGESAAPGAFNPTKDSALGRFTTDFTELARQGRLDPVFCRDREIRQMVDILSRRRKNNPIAVGDAGVGKTAVIEGLALRIVDDDVPESLRGVSILGLDLGLLQAGASVKGEFEKRLTQVIKEVKDQGNGVILFIDEAHTLIGSGGNAGTGDAANLLKPELARGELRSIAATTWSEYKKYFERDPALARRFQLVKLDEPSPADAATIMRGLRASYEKVHGVYIRDEAIVAAADMAARYISGRQLPDKAIDVLDTACARVAIGLSSMPHEIDDIARQRQTLLRERDARVRDLKSDFADHGSPALAALDVTLGELDVRHDELHDRWQAEREIVARLVDLRARLHAEDVEEADADDTGLPEGEALRTEIERVQTELADAVGDEPLVPYEVTAETIGRVISDWTGVPLGKMVRSETDTLMRFSELMKARVMGQDEALDRIGRRLRTAKAGLGNPEAPLGIFLMPGPSGVGKTETALAVADLLFGGSQSLTVINMGEFQEKHTVSRLIGSPPGYVGYGEGGVLSEAVRQKPYSVVLLDEVEKGHVDVLNLFYQVFDKGWLADGEGRQIDFRNTVIFLTTNLASDVLQEAVDADASITLDGLAERIRPMLSKHFRPALLARMEVIPYRPIAREVMDAIIEHKLGKVAERLSDHYGLELSYGEPLLDYIRQRCTDAASGARNVESIITQHVLPVMAERMLREHENTEDNRAVIIGVGDNNRVTVERAAA